MYKIKQNIDANGMPTNSYTLYCYFFDSYSHSYREIWNISGLKEDELVQFLQKNTNKELDTDFGFVVLKSGNGPIIFTTDGDIHPAPVKREVTLKEQTYVGSRLPERKSVLSRKKRTSVSN